MKEEDGSHPPPLVKPLLSLFLPSIPIEIIITALFRKSELPYPTGGGGSSPPPSRPRGIHGERKERKNLQLKSTIFYDTSRGFPHVANDDSSTFFFILAQYRERDSLESPFSRDEEGEEEEEKERRRQRNPLSFSLPFLLLPLCLQRGNTLAPGHNMSFPLSLISSLSFLLFLFIPDNV